MRAVSEVHSVVTMSDLEAVLHRLFSDLKASGFAPDTAELLSHVTEGQQFFTILRGIISMAYAKAKQADDEKADLAVAQYLNDFGNL